MDDLEAALRAAGNLALFSDRESSVADSLVAAYIVEKVSLSAGSEKLAWQYIGKEMSEDLAAGYFYLQAVLPEGSAYVLRNTVLYELYDDQLSICTIRLDGRKMHHALLDRKVSETSFSVRE